MGVNGSFKGPLTMCLMPTISLLDFTGFLLPIHRPFIETWPSWTRFFLLDFRFPSVNCFFSSLTKNRIQSGRGRSLGSRISPIGNEFFTVLREESFAFSCWGASFFFFSFLFFCAATLRAPFDPGGSHSLFSFLSRPLFHGLHLASGFSKDSNGMMTETDWFNHFRATPSTFDSAFDPIINNESDTRLFFFTGLQCHQCFLNQSFETLVVRPCFSHRTVHQRGRCVEIMMGPSCSCWASSFFSGCRQCFLSNNGWKWWPPSFFVLNFLRDTFKSPIQTRSNGAVGIERERETRKNVGAGVFAFRIEGRRVLPSCCCTGRLPSSRGRPEARETMAAAGQCVCGLYGVYFLFAFLLFGAFFYYYSLRSFPTGWFNRSKGESLE